MSGGPSPDTAVGRPPPHGGARPAAAEVMAARRSTFVQVAEFLDRLGIAYRMIRHAPEGNTERASRIRGHALREAAKSLVVAVKLSK
ncbi:MAG TPA: hypothetical protein VFX28_20970, partial [Methylomirabilota bacterium]|nr:hypothetical protein [Methylomirabilota bacterium]